MSLLSDTQGKPERVHSLLQLVSSLGGRAPKDQLLTWMMPRSFRNDDQSLVQVRQTIGCSRSLGLARDDGDDLVLDEDVAVPADPLEFADLAHCRLRDAPSEPDRVVMLAYAYFVLETARTGSTNWIHDQSGEKVANQINAVLQRSADPGADRLFNSTKYGAWRDWMVALGLGYEAGKTLPSFFPHPAERLARELRHIVRLHGKGTEIPASTFVKAVAVQMPYLDGGAVFEDVAGRLGWRPKGGWVTSVLSESLRDLHDEGVLHLIGRADAPDALSLAPDVSSPLKAFVGVVIPNGGA